jgi:tricarballylate dehydrogenase
MATQDSGAVERYDTDVVVIGGGISGLCAAISAREAGASPILIEKSPRAERGGNTRFADAQMRFPHVADEYGKRDYTPAEMIDDLMRISRGRANPELVETLVANASDTIEWLTKLGVEWEEGYPHTAGYRRAPKSGGQGLIDTLFRRLESSNVGISYDTAARELILTPGGDVAGVRCWSPDGLIDIYASGGVILACGGFQANVQMRVSHLGRFADSLILRGSRFNTGEGIRMAIDAGAQAAGQWGDYHSAVIDARSPRTECGVTALYNFQMGIIVNGAGERFLDEGEDFRDHTYVKFSKAIIERADGVGFCIFDQQMVQREEFMQAWRPVGPPIEAGTIGELAEKLGIPRENLEVTVDEYNAAVQPGEFNLDKFDGKAAVGVTPPKSNWAMPLIEPPFWAIPVTGGITFTFGGLKVNTSGQVINTSGSPIEGLYAAGEPIGEFFYYNYPGATSVIRGAVFGRITGEEAARRAATAGVGA